MPFGFEFNLGAVIAVTLISIVSAVETVGDTSATTKAGAGRDATDDEISGATYADGLGTAVAGVFGGLPNTSFSQNVGIVGMTGVMSRHVVTIAGAIMVICGLLPKIGALIASMPMPVLGGGVFGGAAGTLDDGWFSSCVLRDGGAASAGESFVFNAGNSFNRDSRSTALSASLEGVADSDVDCDATFGLGGKSGSADSPVGGGGGGGGGGGAAAATAVDLGAGMRAGGFPLGNGGGFGGSGGGFGIVATVGLRGASISFANVGRGGVLGFLRDRAAVHSPPESEFAASSSVGSGVFDRGVVGASGSSSASSATVISSRSTSRATFVSARFALDDEDFRFFFEDAPPADLLELASPPRRTSSSSSNALSAASKRASSSALTCSFKQYRMY